MFWKAAVPMVCFSGFMIGVILADKFEDETFHGRKLLLFFWKTVLSIICIHLLLTNFYFWPFIAGAAIGIFLRTPLLFLGIAMASAWSSSLFLTASLIFIFSVPYGSFLRSMKVCNKTSFISSLLFFAPLPLIFLPSSYLAAMGSLAAGLIVPCIFLKESLIYPHITKANLAKTIKLSAKRHRIQQRPNQSATKASKKRNTKNKLKK